MASEVASLPEDHGRELPAPEPEPAAASAAAVPEEAVTVTLPLVAPPVPDQTGSPTFLTSHTVPKQEGGDYVWNLRDWLLPHEPIRREFARAMYALDRMDVVARPWQAYAFNAWLRDFYFPAIHAHHDVEEHIVGPHFEALGEKIVFGPTYNHEVIIARMDAALALSQDTAVAVKAMVAGKTPETTAAATVAFAALKAAMVEVHAMLSVHLGEEEAYWPPVYLKHGEAEPKKVVTKIVATDMKKKGKEFLAFKAFAGALLDAMQGTSNASAPAWALRMQPWCSPAFAAQFMAELPWVPRTLIFPAWHKEFIAKWKAMIDACAGTENTLGIDETGYPAPPPGCACTVQ